MESFVAHLIFRLIKINNFKYFSRPSGSTNPKPGAVFVLIIETEVDISVFSLMVASGFYEEKIAVSHRLLPAGYPEDPVKEIITQLS